MEVVKNMYYRLFDSVLTDEDFERAIELDDASEIADQVIKPRLKAINELTGQRNDPIFMAFALMNILKDNN
jgi:hypothetical protein